MHAHFLIAGGPQAMFRSVEGAEDNRALGAAVIAVHNPGPGDIVIALSASGTAPWAVGVIEQAKASGALTIGMANNPRDAATTLHKITDSADYGLNIVTGAEPVAGSTRMRAGSAQMAALDMLLTEHALRCGMLHAPLLACRTVHASLAVQTTEHAEAVDRVYNALSVIEKAARDVAHRLSHPDARLILAGTGRAGLVALQDLTELRPTYGESRVEHLYKGGAAAVFDPRDFSSLQDFAALPAHVVPAADAA